MMIWALSALSGLGFLAIFILALCAPRLGYGRYWPPEQSQSWQHTSFRALFRLGLYPLVAVSALIARDVGFSMPILGGALIIIGFGAALAFTGKLGWKQAFGRAEGLVTTGPYALSRNPVYVATWLALLGWAICVPHAAVLGPLALWAVLYLIAPFWEEPWLEERFGTAFIEYKKTTPRFFFGL